MASAYQIRKMSSGSAGNSAKRGRKRAIRITNDERKNGTSTARTPTFRAETIEELKREMLELKEEKRTLKEQMQRLLKSKELEGGDNESAGLGYWE